MQLVELKTQVLLSIQLNTFMSYDYNGPEIISKLIINPVGVKGAGKIKQRQLIDVKCFNCGNIKRIDYLGHAKNRLKSNKDMYWCHACISCEHITNYNKSYLGKTLEERLGMDIANKIKASSKKYAIDNNISDRLIKFRGMSWEEKFGKSKSDELKIKFRESNILKPMYGSDNYQWKKPAHKLSGKGTKGYYNNTYFRSLMEASFIVNFLEKYNMVFESGELKKYAFKYNFEGRYRNYFCDFVSNDIFYEIKPKSLHNSLQNISKWDAAKKWCDENNKIFKIYSEYDFDLLTQADIDNLKNCGKLTLI